MRDLAELEQAHGTRRGGDGLGAAVRALYQEGAAYDRRAPPPSSGGSGRRKAAALEQRAHTLGLQWAHAQEHPTQALCQRVLRHEGELFEFVRQAEVAATNNAAERAIRPLAVARKISGGTRSAAGSTTRMRLADAVYDVGGQGGDPLQACLEMLGAKTPLPSS